MAYYVMDLKCPNCGFPISVGQKECPAGHPINITSLNSVNSMPSPMVNRYINFYKNLKIFFFVFLLFFFIIFFFFFLIFFFFFIIKIFLIFFFFY